MNSKVSFSRTRFIQKSLLHHWRISLAVGLGVASATAVITGALLVGDSMRGSLRGLTIQRLGQIDYVLVPGSFFQSVTSESLTSIEDTNVQNAVSAILFVQAVAETSRSEETQSIRRAGSIQVLACGEDYWSLDPSQPPPAVLPEGDQVVLNQSTAKQLKVKVGDRITVRLPVEQAVPADSPLGRRDSETEGLPRLEIVDIVPDSGLGGFSLSPSQQQPLNAFLPIELVQDALDRENQANVVLIDVEEDAADLAHAHQVAEELTGSLNLSLSDYGIKVENMKQTFTDASGNSTTIFDYYSVTSDRLLLPDVVSTKLSERLGPEAQPVMTFLANAIEKEAPTGTASVPYSIITAADSSESLPLDFGDYDPDDDTALTPLVINDWTAKQLNAKRGDEITIYYYEPETTSGKEIELSFMARVSDIVTITEPVSKFRRSRKPRFEQAPTCYNDPDLTPTVPGVTDQDSIDDWDLPFKLVRPRSDADDDYWDYYRLTPKAFIPLADGKRLFGSRFGNTTSIKIQKTAVASQEALEETVTSIVDQSRSELGFAVIPTRAMQLAASKGTTPFDALFLSLSFFVIVAALMLVALLFRLGLEQRADEFGTLMATGCDGKLVAGLAMSEGWIVSFIGSSIGVAGGFGYAWLVLYSLRTWLVGAVTVPFLEFHWSPLSIVIGIVSGTLMATATLWWTSRKLRSTQIWSLVSGRLSSLSSTTGQQSKWIRIGYRGSFVVALLCSVIAMNLGGQAQAGAFVGGGMLLLAGVVLWTHSRLVQARVGSDVSGFNLKQLAINSARRNPLRSTLSIGLLAVSCFLIISMSAFQMAPTEEGVGGFDLIGRTAVPIYRDLGDIEVRADLLGSDTKTLEDMNLFGLRLRPGQDASCNNLYQAAQPQVLGVPNRFVAHFNDPSVIQFNWMGASTLNPWESVQRKAAGTAEDPIPVILDQNTAMWALQMYGGVGESKAFEYEPGKPLYFQVTGLLMGSVLQGSLIIGEDNFEDAFPNVNGYQFFLMRSGNAGSGRSIEILEERLGDTGMDVVSSADVLSRLHAVQNTYLRTFQALGAIGLLLGTFGLATVQLRSVLERRGEMAVMRATGFSRRRLASMVIFENSTLLGLGIGCGVVAAAAGVIPYMVLGSAQLTILEPVLMVLVVFLVGLLAGLLAVSKVLRSSLIESLRG